MKDLLANKKTTDDSGFLSISVIRQTHLLQLPPKLLKKKGVMLNAEGGGGAVNNVELLP